MKTLGYHLNALGLGNQSIQQIFGDSLVLYSTWDTEDYKIMKNTGLKAVD
jgi:hypothetical protein